MAGDRLRLTAGQALIQFLRAQYVERDGVENAFFPIVFGIFGHGNVGGVGEALRASRHELRYIPARNEQAMVHAAAAFARARNRLATCACTTSVGPGATNMITGAAGATINHLPVLLLPSDVFATRRSGAVLQQLERRGLPSDSVNDAFAPVSVFFDRISRPEQLLPSLLYCMELLTSPKDTGAATIALPQDVQAEAFDFPPSIAARRVWHIERVSPDPACAQHLCSLIGKAKRPLIVAGGGVIYSGATRELTSFARASGIPVAVTQAGKGAVPEDMEFALGAIGATGTAAANHMAARADLVIGIGTRWTDFTTASRTLFAQDAVFASINVVSGGLLHDEAVSMTADARMAIEALAAALSHFRVPADYASEIRGATREWHGTRERLLGAGGTQPESQAAVIGAVNAAVGDDGVVVCAAGSMPGDLHKLWLARVPGNYHVEYGYSCMGYEIAGGLGAALADPARPVVVMVGDGSYLMLCAEIVTAVQERVGLTIVIVDNHGYGSIGALSTSLGLSGFGTRYGYRSADGDCNEDVLPVDLVANARSLGANVVSVQTAAQLKDAVRAAMRSGIVTAIHIEVAAPSDVPSFDSWWDVPVAEHSEDAGVRAAAATNARQRERQRPYGIAGTRWEKKGE